MQAKMDKLDQLIQQIKHNSDMNLINNEAKDSLLLSKNTTACRQE